MGVVVGFPEINPEDAAVGARLRRWREERSTSLEHLARILDVSLEEVRRAETGRAHLNSCQIAAATAALRLPVWALVSDTRAY